jgi:ABC-type uncharacterized transport system permease subunit
MDYPTIISILSATLRFATPLLLACLAGLYSERAGVFDIGLEGKMLFAAFAAAAVAALTGSMWLGLMAGIFASLTTAMVQGVASISLKAGSARAVGRRRSRMAGVSPPSGCRLPPKCVTCRSSGQSIQP